MVEPSRGFSGFFISESSNFFKTTNASKINWVPGEEKQLWNYEHSQNQARPWQWTEELEATREAMAKGQVSSQDFARITDHEHHPLRCHYRTHTLSHHSNTQIVTYAVTLPLNINCRRCDANLWKRKYHGDLWPVLDQRHLCRDRVHTLTWTPRFLWGSPSPNTINKGGDGSIL